MIKLVQESEVIVFDADDTLVDFFGRFLDYYNTTYRTSFTKSDFLTSDLPSVLRCELEECKRRFSEFQDSLFFKQIPPLEDSVESIDLLFSMGKKLYVNTSRPYSIRDDTEKHLEPFKGKFLDIIYSFNHHTGIVNSGKSKGEICKSLGGSLVDNDVPYIMQCISLGLGGVLFGDSYNNRNEAPSLPSSIAWAKDWKEIMGVAA
jgi:uncharacterized HAD superfamily protein